MSQQTREKELVNPAERISIHNFLRGMYDHTEQYLNKMVLPINNYLKDFSQIDTELSQEIHKDAHFMTLDGQMVPVEQVLNRPMEENY